MKKIGFVTPWYGDNIGGGAEMELRGLVHHLHDFGQELEILTTCVESFTSDWNTNYYEPKQTVESGITVKRFLVRERNKAEFDRVNYKFVKNKSYSFKDEEVFLKEMVNSPDLYKYMDEHKDEYSLFVFIPYMFGTTYYGMQVCKEKSVMIPCLHDESYAYMQHFKDLYSQIAGIIFHAKPEYELANRIYDLTNVKTAVLGEGVYTDIQGDANRFIDKYKITDDFIIYAGRKDKGKNVDTLIKYFDKYKRRNHSNLKLVLIGGGEIKIPRSRKNDILDLGFVDIQDKYDAYAASKLLCQPSKHESFSLVIMESWLCKTPVLVSGDCEVTKNFAIESNGGLYFSNYHEFQESVNCILNNSEKAEIMGENGYQYVNDHFAWDVIVENYMDFFHSIEQKCDN